MLVVADEVEQQVVAGLGPVAATGDTHAGAGVPEVAEVVGFIDDDDIGSLADGIELFRKIAPADEVGVGEDFDLPGGDVDRFRDRAPVAEIAQDFPGRVAIVHDEEFTPRLASASRHSASIHA